MLRLVAPALAIAVAGVVAVGSSDGRASPHATSAAAAYSNVKVVVDHLDNPRGLFVDSTGTLWVAEAGRAGKDCLKFRRTAVVCWGRTGQILRITHGRVHTFASGLSSLSFFRFGTLGADDVSVAPNGSVFTAVISDEELLSPRVKRRALGGQVGKLLRFRALGGRPHVQANVSKLRGPFSHPYGVLALRGRELVTDSEQNTLIEVRGHRARVIFHFPPGDKGADSVPTWLAHGPDGAVYIGELSGIDAGPGQARIWRMIPGQKPRVWATGFNSILGLAFGPDGTLYVCEFSRNFAADDPHGDVVRIAPDGGRTTLGAGQLFRPGGIAVGSDGTIYVSNWSTLTGRSDRAGHRGQLVELTP
jgi:hypothetical protein